MRKPTIYEALCEKLGREPTHEEIKADVRRILEESATELAAKGLAPAPDAPGRGRARDGGNMRKILESEVIFSLSVEQDGIPIRGNVMASGDDEADRKEEEEVIRRLNNGDVWAWAAVTVHATLTLPDGSTMTGEDHLGGCSYADEADFTQPGGYYDDMRHEALAVLQRKIEAEINRGAMLAELFAQCPWETVSPGGRRCVLAPGHDGGHVLP